MLDTVQALNQLDTLVFDKASASAGPQADPDSYITVPDAHLLFSGDFKRVGTTGLKITGDDGQSFFIEDYFKSEKHKHLLSPEGAMLSANVVAALAGPLALLELARITDGAFTPVHDPALLSDIFGEVEFAEVEELDVRNVSLGEAAHATAIGADGSFSAFVPLRTGRNDIEVVARASNGRSTTERVTVHFAPDAAVADVPAALLPIRNKLLELRLTQLRRARIAGEQERVESLRDRLAREIEAERAKAGERAAEQRKRLDLKIERDRSEPKADAKTAPANP